MTVHTINGDYDIDEFNGEYTVQLAGDEIVFATIKDAKIAILDDIHQAIWKDNPVEQKKMYDENDVNLMMKYITEDKVRYKYFCKYLANSEDGRAIKTALSEGWYEAFMRYDSDVMEQFITMFENLSINHKDFIKDKAEDMLRLEEF